MLNTYKGILRGDRIEWGDEAPNHLEPNNPVAVSVTILDDGSDVVAISGQGRVMAAALERIAVAGGVSEIVDPAAWERELRQDPPLEARVD